MYHDAGASWLFKIVAACGERLCLDSDCLYDLQTILLKELQAILLNEVVLP